MKDNTKKLEKLESKLARKKREYDRLDMQIDALRYDKRECQCEIEEIEAKIEEIKTGKKPAPKYDTGGYTSAPTITFARITQGGSGYVHPSGSMFTITREELNKSATPTSN